MSSIISDLKFLKSIFLFNWKQTKYWMQQFCSFCFRWQKYLLPLRLILNIIYPEMEYNSVVLKVCGQDSAPSLSSYFWFFLNILQLCSHSICPVAVVPALCLMVQRVFHKADSDFNFLPLHTTGCDSPTLSLSLQAPFLPPDWFTRLINGFGNIFWVHRWW